METKLQKIYLTEKSESKYKDLFKSANIRLGKDGLRKIAVFENNKIHFGEEDYNGDFYYRLYITEKNNPKELFENLKQTENGN